MTVAPFCKLAFVFLFLVFGHTLSLIQPGPASAQDTASLRVLDLLSEGHDISDESADDDSLRRAMEKANEAVRVSANPYEWALSLEFRTGLHGELGDYEAAINDLERALREREGPPGREEMLNTLLGHLHFVSGAYQSSVASFERAMELSEEARADHHFYIAGAYTQLDDFPAALPHARALLNFEEPARRIHYDLLNYVYANLNMTAERRILLEEMNRKFPNDSGILQQLAGMDEDNTR